MRWVECIGPEGQIGRLRPYIPKTSVNLWGHDLLQQWNTQINIPAAPKTYVSEENIRRYYRRWTAAIWAIQEHKAGAGEMAQRLRALPALLGVLSSIPSNHMVAHNHL